jgi:thiol-disulfide isomerase/thioredoxin
MGNSKQNMQKTTTKNSMRNVLILGLFFSIISCSTNPQKTIDRTLNKLSTNKALKYDIEQLTIQGNDSDTLFIHQKTEAVFQKLENNEELIGFKFTVVDTFVHPYFNVPLKNTTTYDGNLFLFESINPMQNQTKISDKSEVEEARMETYKSGGHLPNLIKLLTGDTFVNRVLKDTVFMNVKSMLITQKDTADMVYELFVQKEQNLPLFLRIISNPTQPFIEEFTYSGFKEVDTNIVVDANYTAINTKVKYIAKGDTIANLALHYLAGEDFSFAPQKGKMTLLCLSMINCGPCQMAVDEIKEMYHHYSTSSSYIRFVAFYPVDAKEKLQKYVEAKNIDYPVVYNSKENPKEYGLVINSVKTTFPSFLLLDDNNTVVWMQTGYNSDLKLINKIEKKIKKYGN